MNIFYVKIFIFNFGIFYMFRTLRFIFRKTVLCAVVLWYV